MKKQTKAGKAQARRNYQVGRCKKRGPVFLPKSEPPKKAKPVPLVRQPYKLTNRLIERLVQKIRAAPGISMEAIAGSVGIHRTTLKGWYIDGETAEPGTLLSKLFWELEKALSQSHQALHCMAARVKPFELLCRRYPSEYGPSRLELTGPDGMPLIPAENPFQINVSLMPPGVEPEKFTIQEPTGEKWTWSPEEDRRRKQGRNGELPK